MTAASFVEFNGKSVKSMKRGSKRPWGSPGWRAK
jgi:hypothetical protein